MQPCASIVLDGFVVTLPLSLLDHRKLCRRTSKPLSTRTFATVYCLLHDCYVALSFVSGRLKRQNGFLGGGGGGKWGNFVSKPVLGPFVCDSSAIFPPYPPSPGPK